MTKSRRSKGIPADGKRIREIRNRLGKTQEQITEDPGVGLRTLARAEKGENISPGALQAIAGKLGVPIEEIRRDVDEVGDPRRINLRLNRLDPVKASKLIEILEEEPSASAMGPTPSPAVVTVPVESATERIWVAVVSGLVAGLAFAALMTVRRSSRRSDPADSGKRGQPSLES